jgi:LysM repeat protein
MKLLISFLVCVFTLTVFSTPTDSIGVKTKGARSYVLHKVDAGETLYGLSKRYDVTVSAIERANTLGSGLSVGQVIFVPTNYSVEKVSANDDNTEEVEYHIVAAGQTLYAISRLYKVSVDDIQKWNKLTSNELSVGQKIIISKDLKVEEVVETVKVVEESKGLSSESDIKEVVVPKVVKKKKTTYNPQKQMGEVILGDEKELNYKYSFCLHPTAPVGSIMVLTCQFNDRVILVKVIGNIDLEDGVILKVNKSVFESLNIDNTTFEAEITYLD